MKLKKLEDPAGESARHTFEFSLNRASRNIRTRSGGAGRGEGDCSWESGARKAESLALVRRGVLCPARIYEMDTQERLLDTL